MDWRDHPQAKEDAPWPYNIGDEVKAVHYANDRHCDWGNPSNCPEHWAASRSIDAYRQWLKYRGVDVDELLVSRQVSST